MKLNKKYTILWIVWIVAVGVIEYAAFKNKKEGDTLSEHVKKLIGTNTLGSTWGNWVVRVDLGGFFVGVVVRF